MKFMYLLHSDMKDLSHKDLLFFILIKALLHLSVITTKSKGQRLLQVITFHLSVKNLSSCILNETIDFVWRVLTRVVVSSLRSDKFDRL